MRPKKCLKINSKSIMMSKEIGKKILFMIKWILIRLIINNPNIWVNSPVKEEYLNKIQNLKIHIEIF